MSEQIAVSSSKKSNNHSETSGSIKDKKDSSKSPVIISQTSGFLDSLDNESNDDCLLTVLELNDGQPKLNRIESFHNKSASEKPKKFRINLIKHKKDIETRKSQLVEEKEMFELRLKRFPGYIISKIKCIDQGDFEPPTTSKHDAERTTETRKIPNPNHVTPVVKPVKIKSEKVVKKVPRYTTSSEESLKLYDNLTDVKIKNEDDFDKEMIKRFPLGSVMIREKWFLTIIYVPDCEIVRKIFIGHYGLGSLRFNLEEFEDWCQKNGHLNSKCMYESYFLNGQSRQSNVLLKTLMTKYLVGIVLSDFFRNRDFAAYRALAMFGDNANNVKLASEEFKSKLPVNILPYIHENPNDENSLAPNDFEEIDYLRRNYHRLMFSEDFFF